MSVAPYLAFTIVSGFIFLLCLRKAWQEDHLVFYGAATVYGILLEKAAIVAFGAYTYAVDQFFLTVFEIPISIGLAWAAILYSGYLTASKFEVRLRLLPVFVGLYILHVDLAIDAIAIRIPYWTWEFGAWYGVPIGNYWGWYFIGFMFVGAYLILRQYISQPLLLGPAVIGSAVALLLGVMQLWIIITSQVVIRKILLFLSLIAASLVLLHVVGEFNRTPEGPLWEPFSSILLFQLFHLGLVLGYGFYQDAPVLLVMSLIMTGVTIGVHLPAFLHAMPLKSKQGHPLFQRWW